MQATLRLQIFMACFACCCCLPVFCQAPAETSNETWSIKPKKGLFGLAKPEFGPYHTIAVRRLDSAVHRKKTKEGTEANAAVSSSGVGMDITKLQTIEKQRYYKLQFGTDTDTTEAVFATASTSKERKQTLLGKMLSKGEESSSAVLHYNRDVSGTIRTGRDTRDWEFFIDNFTSGSRQTEEKMYPHASIARTYLVSGNDSLYTKATAWSSMNIELYKGEDEKAATLEYSGKMAAVWIRSDMEPSQRRVVATLFAVIIAIRDL